MKFSIVTPCLNSNHYIGRCVASVADQDGVDFEHIIQDGGSTDGTLATLQKCASPHTHVIQEADRGMYDALNSGFDRASGEILAHLNSDEQYLPEALASVEEYFERHPETDILFTDVLVLRDDASFVCYQKVVKPTRAQILLSHLPTYTAGTFFKRRIWEEGCRFNISKKALGDSWWMLKVLEGHYRMECLRHYTSAVTATDENLSLSEVAREETRELFKLAGAMRRTKWQAQFLRYRLTKMLRGCYRQKPFSYAVYIGDDDSRRQDFTVRRPSAFWMQMRKLKSLNYYDG